MLNNASIADKEREALFFCTPPCPFFFNLALQKSKAMHKIIVEGINLYAYHGCLEEEGKIGANYTVDVTMETDFTEAAQTDNLHQTIDYVIVYNIVKAEMAVRAKLLEHVGQRIVNQLKKQFALLTKVEVKVTKLNPPMNGNVNKVSIVISA